jgi:hypothetical protein
MNAGGKNMLVLADRFGKIVAAYIPGHASGPDCPQLALVADHEHAIHKIEIPHEWVSRGFDGAALRRYRVRIESAEAKLVLHDPKENDV